MSPAKILFMRKLVQSTVVITTSGPFVVPLNVGTLTEVRVLASGGGGGLNAGVAIGGGGSGERRVISNLAVTPGETLDIVIGAAGLGKTSTAGSGGTASNTTFKRSATVLGQANGGSGGAAAADGAGGTGGSGGTGTNGNSGVLGVGGVSVDSLFPAKSFGGIVGDTTAPFNGTNGGLGVVQIIYFS